MSVWLIVGLGNPGPQYALTRHNIGFMAVDLFAEGHDARNWKSEHNALVVKIKTDQRDFTGEPLEYILAKPQSYMNLSGGPTQALLSYYKIPLEKLVVVHDDVDTQFGQLRLFKNRGPGGQNGVKSIHEAVGADYIRLKLGIGRSSNPQISTADHVLQKFSVEEMDKLPEILNRAGDAIEGLCTQGLPKASSLFNS